MIKALILNDTRLSGHPGCLLVMSQLSEWCAVSGIQITRALPLSRKFFPIFRSELQKCDVVIINGEGTMHHDSLGALMLSKAGKYAYEVGKPVVLINTVWEENRQANEVLPFLSLIAARESLSARAIAENGIHPRIVPDLVFSCPSERLFVETPTTQNNIVVMDDVRPELAKILAKYAFFRKLQFIRMESRPSLRSLRSIANWSQIFLLGRCQAQFKLDQGDIIKNASLVVTGRFHGVCLAMLAGRPFIAVSSNTHKIEGLLTDADLGEAALFLEVSELFENPFEKIDLAVEKLREVIKDISLVHDYQVRCNSYINKAKNDMALMFSDINVIGQQGER
jgi:polysaccharide pyruvyl transferase WcaK-like protein